jgi:putative transcriptional regulator
MEAMMTKLGERLILSVKEARAIARGEAEPARVFVPPSVLDVAAIRRKTGLSQDLFASRYGFSAAAVRDWEQGRRNPEAAARTLLLVIERDQAAVDRALAMGSH